MVILQLVPTIVEVAMIAAVLLYQFDWRYVVVILITVALYMWYTYHCDRMADRHPPQDERERHRRQHQGDRFAAQLRNRQIFQRRGARDRSATTARWRAMRQASVDAYVSLAVLNAGQAAIFTLG